MKKYHSRSFGIVYILIRHGKHEFKLHIQSEDIYVFIIMHSCYVFQYIIQFKLPVHKHAS